MQNIWSHYEKNARVSIVRGGKKNFIAWRAIPILYQGASHTHTQCKRQQRQLMKTIFVPSQRTRSPSHNCQSCNKSLCGTNEYGIGNETKLIGMLCQLDSTHPPFHTRPFICEVVQGCLSLSLSFSLSLSPPSFSLPLSLTRILSPSLSIPHTHTHTHAHKKTHSHTPHVKVTEG